MYKIDNINNYQKFTRSTAFYPQDQAMTYLLLGLTEEAGEVAGKMKKFMRDSKGTAAEQVKLNEDIIKELGDVMWYASRIADTLDVDMSTVLEGNVSKLLDRQDRGTQGGSGDNR